MQQAVPDDFLALTYKVRKVKFQDYIKKTFKIEPIF
jgi:hypothetical protein